MIFNGQRKITLPVIYDELKPHEKRLVREAYIENQGGKCYYCKASLKDTPPPDITNKNVTPTLYPRNFFDNPVHLHHSHVNGYTLGAVHAYCNAVLWEHEGE